VQKRCCKKFLRNNSEKNVDLNPVAISGFRQWHAENALIFEKYAGFLVYVRYLLEVF